MTDRPRHATWSCELAPGESPEAVLRREFARLGKTPVAHWDGEAGWYSRWAGEWPRLCGAGELWIESRPDGPHACWSTRLDRVGRPEDELAMRLAVTRETLGVWAAVGCSHEQDGHARRFHPQLVLDWLRVRPAARTSRGRGTLAWVRGRLESALHSGATRLTREVEPCLSRSW